MKNSLFLSYLITAIILFATCSSTEPETPALPEDEENSTEIGTGETNGYKLVWEDLFNGKTLDETNNWTVEVNGNGGGNSELQYYRRENISIGTEPISGASCLIITAKKENYLGKTCTSGRLVTFGKMSFKYGKIEARIKLPKTANGLWPAFWMMGKDYSTVGWPKCGEIDILEMGNVNGIKRGTQDKYFSTWFHWGESWNNGSYPNWGKDFTNPTGIQDDFHLFTFIWDENSMKSYLDLDKNPGATPICEMAINGADVAGNAAHYFKKKFFVIFNLAIGGNFTQIWDIDKVTALNTENDFTSHMYVDYVRLYQKNVTGEEYEGPQLTKVKTVSDNNEFIIYQTQGKNQLNIQSNNAVAEVKIYSVTGALLKTANNKNTIDIAELKTGNYIVQITDNTGKTEAQQITVK